MTYFLFYFEGNNLLFLGTGHKAHANVIVSNVCPHIRRLCCPFPLAILRFSFHHKTTSVNYAAEYHTENVCIFLVCVCGKRFWLSWVCGILLIWRSAFSLAPFGSIIMAHFKDWTSGTTNRKWCLWGLSASGPHSHAARFPSHHSVMYRAFAAWMTHLFQSRCRRWKLWHRIARLITLPGWDNKCWNNLLFSITVQWCIGCPSRQRKSGIISPLNENVFFWRDILRGCICSAMLQANSVRRCNIQLYHMSMPKTYKIAKKERFIQQFGPRIWLADI